VSADDPLLDQAAIEDDIRFLVKHLGLSAVEDVLALCAEVFPDEEVSARARLVLEDSFGDH
jgi:hypothetical protein